MLIQEQVLGLQVAMAHTVVVAVLDALHKLAKVEARKLLIELALTHNLVKQLATLDQLQHDKDLGDEEEAGGRGRGEWSW